MSSEMSRYEQLAGTAEALWRNDWGFQVGDWRYVRRKWPHLAHKDMAHENGWFMTLCGHLARKHDCAPYVAAANCAYCEAALLGLEYGKWQVKYQARRGLR